MAKRVIDSKPEAVVLQQPKRRWAKIKKNWDLYLLVLPVVIYFLIFKYYPMYGVQIAFKDFVANQGILGSEWVGFEHFIRFFLIAFTFGG